ncbi:MAG: HAD family phosphatase [Clostridia bacterium]|nr:HAD family phosphatase [Clostridia bacterium]
MKTLYISDLDGTLLNKSAELSERSAEIISHLCQKGMLFTIATARSLSSIEILDRLDIQLPCVQLNGVLMYDFGTKAYTGCTPIETKAAQKVTDILRAHDRMSFVYKSDSEYGIHVEFEKLKNEVERNFFEARKDKDYKSFSQTDKIQIGDSDKVIYFTMVDEYDKLLPIHQEISCVAGARSTLYSDNYSRYYFLEVFSSKATKARGMLKIKELLGAERVVAFGDNLNDIEMLKAADVGIAVGDAVEDVKVIADTVIGNSYEDGVAEYLLSEYRSIK